MKKLLACCVLCSVYLQALPLSVPVDVLYSPNYTQCLQHALNEYDAVACTEQERKQQDKKLSNTYKKVMNSLTSSRQKDLQRVQRLWIQYTDAKCSFFYHKQSGSAGLGAAAQCKLNETIRRTLELKEIQQ